MLLAQFPGQVFYSHGIQPRTVTLVRDFSDGGLAPNTDLLNAFADNPAILAGLAANADTGGEVTLVSGVRDPVARSLSVAMQMLDTLFVDCRGETAEETADRLAARIRALWTRPDESGDASERMAHATIRAPLDWLADEIERPFGFDLLAEPFDVTRGYQVLTNGPVRLLLYRMENAPDAIEAGLATLFEGRSFALPRANLAEEKPDHATYALLKQRFRLPAAVLETIYDAPYVRAFFSADEIADAKARWLEPAGSITGGHVVAAGGRFRATVAMSVLNHAGWVGGQLRSLFAQWRPDIDLIVMDDGSTDGSFEVVREALATRPDIAATLLRNERPLGHGVIARLLSHTDSQIIIQADSDDLSLPGRLDAILGCFERDARCRLVTSNALLVSAEGASLGLLDVQHDDAVFDDPQAAADQRGDIRWVGASAAFHRGLLEDFPFDPEVCPYGLDLLLALRATLTGTHHYLAEPLIAWRQHPGNSHRLAGVYSADDVVQERYRSLELMALAQRIRDVRRAEAMSSDPRALDVVAGRAHHLFLEQFTAWSRIHNRLTAANQDRNARPRLAPSVQAPPMITLSPGVARAFGQGDPLGVIASEWNGFHPPESRWNWTARRALLGVRAPGARRLILRLAGLSFTGSQSVRLRAGDGPWTEVEITDLETEVEVEVEVGSGSDFLAVRIEAPGAARPCDHVPEHPDQRQLGVRLFAIEAV